MTVSEAAKHYGVSVRTIRRWCAEGRIPAKRLADGKWDIDPDDRAAKQRPENDREMAAELTAIREEVVSLKGLQGGQIMAALGQKLTDLAAENQKLREESQRQQGELLALLQAQFEETAALRRELTSLRETVEQPPWWAWWRRK